MSKKKIITLVGPSGSGKTTIGEKLTKQGIPKLITTTSRTPRKNEKNGCDYYFCDVGSLSKDLFVEQTVYNGHQYGLTKAEVDKKLKENDIVHVSLDQQGVYALKKAYPAETKVFFIPIDLNEMISRMKQRGDSKEDIDERIRFSQTTEEMTPPKETDFIIENINVDQTVQAIINKVLKK